ncbi:hypothetical protein [Dyadobacter fermentans]|uniref:hypothetical protein n=1 Tax=Dyadobacter fermentans TaxID=94254 RepID=UPI00019B5D58|nr:hypothetical protein [Dyadobacter fermentans]
MYKEKKIIGRDDTAKSKIYWADGREVTTGDLKIGKDSYLGRRKKIVNDLHIPDFQSDREGRAHLITRDMKKVVQKMYDDNEVFQANGQKEYKPFYAYFILDDVLGEQTLSVVFAVSEITTELEVTKIDGEWVDDPPVAYDHGTACCPIG